MSDIELQKINVTLIYHLWSVVTHLAMSYANLLQKNKDLKLKKEFNSHRTVLGQQHGGLDVV